MVTIYEIKPKFQALLRPLCGRLAAWGVTANQVTLAALALSILTGLLMWRGLEVPGLYLLGPVVLFVRMALNALDGMLAREHGQKSALGGMLNELSDVISDAALYLPLAAWGGRTAWLTLAVIFAATLTEFVGVAAVQIGASRRYDGPLGKSDRAFLFGLLYLGLGTGLLPARMTPALVQSMLGLALLGSVATILNRTRRALAEVAR
jgi:CDP-diacylglycerol--glycerol-3-phosphate 3-phosphatidyltransferase